MPYNNTPIAPSKEITGTVSLPLARVKKIISQDDDINSCSNNAAFVITVATEMFLQHLVEQSHNVVKSERKPRRNIQYRDVANAVARVENLEFLTDVVPKTQTYKQVKQKQAKEPAARANGVANGQRTLDQHMGEAGEGQATNGAAHEPEDMDIDNAAPAVPIGKLDQNYLGLGLKAETTLGEKQPAEIDLVNEPQKWISGFDAGFNNRPLVPGNTQQYCEGYMHGQHAWKNPAASPSLSSAASEVSSFGSLDADTIDPRLLDLNASSDDDLFKTPTQLTATTCSVERNSNMQISSPSHARMQDSERGFGRFLDMNPSSIDVPLSTTASNIHEAFESAPSWTPINAHKVPRVRSAPTARTSSPPLVTCDAYGNMNHMSPCVRRSLSMAKHARVAAELLESQGISGAAAAAVADATHWEKKARRRQAKNDSQNRIRAEQRAGKLARRT
ncbi:hypothetical protein MBLNU13_g02435t1 [Cladosporium sp. NU13]